MAKADLQTMLALLDAAIADRPYLVGDRFTLADLATAGFIPYLQFVKYDISAYANAKAWSGRCLSRSTAQRAHAM